MCRQGNQTTSYLWRNRTWQTHTTPRGIMNHSHFEMTWGTRRPLHLQVLLRCLVIAVIGFGCASGDPIPAVQQRMTWLATSVSNRVVSILENTKSKPMVLCCDPHRSCYCGVSQRKPRCVSVQPEMHIEKTSAADDSVSGSFSMQNRSHSFKLFHQNPIIFYFQLTSIHPLKPIHTLV